MRADKGGLCKADISLSGAACGCHSAPVLKTALHLECFAQLVALVANVVHLDRERIPSQTDQASSQVSSCKTAKTWLRVQEQVHQSSASIMLTYLKLPS